VSNEGIRLFASVLSTAQETRNTLLRMGTKPKNLDKEDIRLGHLLDEMKDSIKEKFSKITLERKH